MARIPEGATTYFLANFSQKLYKNEENFGSEGGEGSVLHAPTYTATDN